MKPRAKRAKAVMAWMLCDKLGLVVEECEQRKPRRWAGQPSDERFVRVRIIPVAPTRRKR